MRVVVASSFFLAGALLSTPVRSELSAVCKYQWATETYALMTYCADPALAKVRRRYDVLRSILKRHMKAGGIDTETQYGAVFDRNVQQKLREKSTKERCSDPFTLAAKKVFYQLISPRGIKGAVSDLKAGKDPNEGDCL